MVVGNLGAIEVASQAEMASHLVNKPPGSWLLTTFTANFLTKSAAGQPIPWYYQVVVRLGHNTWQGWRQPQDLDPAWPTGHNAKIYWGQGENSISALHQAPPDPNQEWDIRVWLLGLPSDDQGEPAGDKDLLIPEDQTMDAGVPPEKVLGNWVGLAYAEHPGAVFTVPGEALVAGSLSAIGVS